MRNDIKISILVLIIVLLVIYVIFGNPHKKDIKIGPITAKEVSDEKTRSTFDYVLEEKEESDLYLLMMCDGGEKFNLDFITVSNSPGPGELPVPTETTLAEVFLDNQDPFYLKLNDNINSKKYTFSNSGYDDKEKAAILEIESNVVELSLSDGTIYRNCINENVELMRMESN